MLKKQTKKWGGQKKSVEGVSLLETSKTCDEEAKAIVITRETIENIDFSVFEKPRTMLLSLCKRPELFRMVLQKHYSISEVETTVKAFDKSMVAYVASMVKFGGTQYKELLEFAKSGVSIPTILDGANELRIMVYQVSEQLRIVRNWSEEYAIATLLDQQRLLILRKRIELATEKLEDTIKTGREIGFTAFMSSVASPFACHGWYNDIPKSFL